MNVYLDEKSTFRAFTYKIDNKQWSERNKTEKGRLITTKKVNQALTFLVQSTFINTPLNLLAIKAIKAKCASATSNRGRNTSMANGDGG